MKTNNNFIKVSARVRPLLPSEHDKVLSIVESKNRGRLLQLETGKHFNLGQKFYEFELLIGAESTQKYVYETCEI